MNYHIAALYKFANIEKPHDFKDFLLPQMKQRKICGTLILAPEGINGTIAGGPDSMQWIISWLTANTPLEHKDVKWSGAHEKPFKKTKIKIKPEIVTLRKEGLDPVRGTGEFVSPDEWNTILDDPDTLVIDTRNYYETQLGGFHGAIDPATESFTDFPEYVENNLDPQKHKKIAMFCTGGIRCEKASAFMRKKGFKNIYQLEGGILKYLEVTPPSQSKWKGECFVFDDRVSVTHGLKQGSARMCWGCGLPLTVEDQQAPEYEDGVCCARCAPLLSDERKQVLRDRHRRILEQKEKEMLAQNTSLDKKEGTHV